jgi:signal transduction histidine kinase/CheY-like chemotaxis protein
MNLPAGDSAMAPPPLREEDFAPRVQRQLVRLVLDNGNTSTAGVFVLAVAMGVLLRDMIPPGVLAAWLSLNTLLAGGRVLAVLDYRRKRDQPEPERLFSVRAYRAMVSLTGLAWGAGAWFLFPGQSALHQVVFMIIMAGLAAGAVPILSPLIRLYRTYAASFLVPVAILLFLRGGEIHISLGVITLFFLAVLINSATRMQEGLVAALENQFRNEAMVESLEAARKAAEAANRAKNAFLANMSHEIRTPMNGVLGALQLLKGSRMDRAQDDLVATACSSAESLLHLLDDILDVSKIEAGRLSLQRRPFHLPELVRGQEQALAPQAAARGLTFDVKMEADPELGAALDGDPARIRQVLSNLLSNAIKFTERGGITLSVSVAARTDDGLRVRFQVSDTGIGIAAVDQPRLFQRFFQADPSLTRKYGGTGLGLAIVRQLVELMGGSLGLESEPGQGSRVWCEIPFPFAASPDAAEAPLDGPGHALAGEVLLAEDNLVNQKVAMSMLKQLGLRVTVASNGQEALALLGQRRFAAVLMDCQMPLLDGYATTAAWRHQEARERLPRTPVIAMTAHAMMGDREKCLAAGMDDYLSKPVRQAALAAVLRAWLPANP